MFVLSSPSGAGKTTMSRALMAEDSGITMSVSATTRSPRPGEVDGVDYYFVSHDQFQSMVEENALLEWATVFGNRYGTPRAPVESALADGRDVLFDIDWQGTQQLQQTDAASDLVRVFILPPEAASAAAISSRTLAPLPVDRLKMSDPLPAAMCSMALRWADARSFTCT
jgi:guanylate kinase